MGVLPSGTVTFLFTDIEGSTRLLKQLGSGYDSVLADHQRLLRDAFAAHGGQEVDTQGDSFFVVFGRARDAVDAAVAAQRSLDAYGWPEGAELRVRMGLHTGEPRVGGDRYVGIGVHRAARISAAAHGGQVLLSNATRELIEDELPQGVTLRDLGEHRLKDIDRPERLYQLVVEGVPDEFPPPKTQDAAPFAGREGELVEAVAQAVTPTRWRPLVLAVPAAAIVAALVAGFLVFGRSGSAAISAVDANALGVVSANGGEIRRQVGVGTTPTGVAAGAGAVWVTNSADGTVSRIDPQTQAVTQTVRVGSGPSGVAVGEGAVWVANGLDGTVSRIDPDANAVVQTVHVGNGPAGVTVGRGVVWVSNANDGSISRIAEASGNVRDTLTVGGGATAVAVGFGSAWVAEAATGQVARLDERTGQALATISVGSAPTALVAGFGSVWVANSGDGTISRIDPRTNSVAATFRAASGPNAIAVGHRAVWVSDELEGTLVEIDPRLSRVEHTTRLANRPEGIVVAGDSVYVAVRATGRAHAGGTLRVASRGGFDFLDPARAYYAPTWLMLSMTNDGLTGFKRVGGAEGGTVVADLAVTLPRPTDGGTTYSFQIRRGIRYSTGAVVRPADFRRAIERSLVSGGPGPQYFSGIVGATACTRKRCDLRRGIVTDDRASTVTFHLKAPDPELLYKLALPVAYAVPSTTPLVSKAAATFPATGPYEVRRFDAKRIAVLVRNPRFHEWASAARREGIPDQIVWRVATPAKQLADVEQGKTDVMADDVPPEQVTAVETRYASQLHINPASSVDFIFLNTQIPPFDDVRVRRALNYGLDRAAIVRAAGGPEQVQPTCQVLPPNFPGYAPYCPYTLHPQRAGTWTAPDLERARRLVAASGTKGQKVTLWWPDFLHGQDVVINLLRTLGYRVDFRFFTDIQHYFTLVNNPRTRPAAGGDGWIADYPSPFYFVNELLTCAGRASINLGNFCDRAIDRGVARARTADPRAASRSWGRIDRELVDAAPWLFLENPRNSTLVSARVGNYQYHPQWGPLLDQLWVR